MSPVWEWMTECGHFKTDNAETEKNWNDLRDTVSDSQAKSLMRLIDAKDELIRKAAQDSYKAGLMDGLDLMMAVYHRQWEKCN